MEQLPAATVSAARAVDDRRFGFGENWKSFLARLDEARIAEAERSLQWLVGRERCDGMRFLDIGSGSGLSSLAARRLGAVVLSFDYDPRSVECTAALRARFFPDDPNWRVRAGLGSRSRLSGQARPIRHRLFLGRAASHRRHARRDRKRGAACHAGRYFRCRALPEDGALLVLGIGKVLVLSGFVARPIHRA